MARRREQEMSEAAKLKELQYEEQVKKREQEIA